jgi:hypothetical protein
MGRQFWLGPQRASQTVRFWAGVDVIHITIAGARVKSLRSHLSTADLTQLAGEGAVAAGPPPSLTPAALAIEERLRAAGHEPPGDAELDAQAELAALRGAGRVARPLKLGLRRSP